MMSTIRSRIFFPVVFLIILFPILSWLLFSSTSGWYMERISRQSLEQLMGSVRSMAGEIYPDADQGELSRSEERMYSKELLSQAKVYIRKGRPEASLLAMNSRMKLTYPKLADYETDTQGIYEVCRDLAAGRAFEGENPLSASVGNRRYMFSLYETESSVNIRGKYLVGYVEIPDTKALLSYTGSLLAVIAGSLALLALAGAWFMADSISRHLRGLCIQARDIGKGCFEPSSARCPIAEIEDLKGELNKMAAELNQTEQRQVTFFQNASHELRTPLMSICGYAQGIQYNVFPDHSQAASVILSETMRMKELVDGILTISRLDSHDIALRAEDVLLADFIEEQLELLRGIGITESVSIECGLMQEDGNRVRADLSLLSKAFQNVVYNCARFAREKVTVSLAEEEGWSVIYVEDDGPGFREEELPHIFERFYKGEQGNFGIGLSITRTAMEYMGGRAEAGNRLSPCHGAWFRLMLPKDGRDGFHTPLSSPD